MEDWPEGRGWFAKEEVPDPRMTQAVGAWVGQAWKVGGGGEGREGFVTRLAGVHRAPGSGPDEDAGAGGAQEGSGGGEEKGGEGEEGGVQGVGVGLALVAWKPQGLAAVLNKVQMFSDAGCMV